MSAIDLSQEIALVTGASRGIGRAIAMTLAAAGAQVIGTATSEKGAQAIDEALKTHNTAGTGKVLNVTDPDSIESLLGDINNNFGAVTILVNNAGITRDNLLMRMKEEDWDSIIDTNLTSAYRMSKSCLRGMMKNKSGRIISIASVVGVTGNAGQANYAAAKAGMIGFTKSLAKEVGSRGVTCNVVAPGFIDTDMTRELGEQQKAQLLENIPLGTLGDAQDIANAVLFLASDMGRYVTGETLHVNGGMHMS